MKLVEAAKLFIANLLWRGLWLEPAGLALVSGLESSDENNRVIAGMFLVRGGRRSFPLVKKALESHRGLPLILTVVGDLGVRDVAADLERYAADDDPQVAQAARDALRALSRART